MQEIYLSGLCKSSTSHIYKIVLHKKIFIYRPVLTYLHKLVTHISFYNTCTWTFHYSVSLTPHTKSTTNNKYSFSHFLCCSFRPCLEALPLTTPSTIHQRHRHQQQPGPSVAVQHRTLRLPLNREQEGEPNKTSLLTPMDSNFREVWKKKRKEKEHPQTSVQLFMFSSLLTYQQVVTWPCCFTSLHTSCILFYQCCNIYV